MRVFIFILPLFLVSQATEEIKNFLKHSIDYNVEPCDNFYRHVCSKEKGYMLDDAFLSPIHEALDKRVIKTGSEKVDRFLKVADYFSRHDFNDQFSEQMKKQFETHCEKNSSKSFLADVSSMYPQSSECIKSLQLSDNCRTDSEHLMGCFGKADVESLQQFITTTLIPEVLYSSWIHQFGTYGAQRLNSTFLEIQSFAKELIKVTPWLQNLNEVDLFESLANRTNLYRDLEQKEASIMSKAIQLADIFENCTQSSILKNVPLHYSCINQLSDYEELLSYDDTYLTKGSDAWNVRSYGVYDVVLKFMYYYVAQNIHNPAEYMAFAGYTMGHEFGHSIVRNSQEDFIFSKSVKECIQSQFTKSCDYFGETDCEILDTQLGDNGADLIGFEITFNLFKEQMGRNLQNQVTDYEQNMNYEQLFFYAYASQWCRPYPSRQGTMHQSGATRTNAVLSQYPEFQKAFKCADTSKMVQSNRERCVLFGSNAPERKVNGNISNI